MNNTQDQEYINEAEDILASYRKSSDKPVFETSCRDDFLLVSKAIHTQRMQLIKEFELTGKIAQSNLVTLNQKFDIVASVLKSNKEYKAEVEEILTGFWQEYTKSPEIHVIKDTTEYWDKKFSLYGEDNDSVTLNCLNDVMEDIARAHIDITGHTREDDDKLFSTMYTTEYLAKATRCHPIHPIHSFAVTNQSWLQGGTILMRANDANPIYSPSAGDMLFIPAQATHRPPELDVNSDGAHKPRFMFLAEIRNLEAPF